MRRFSFFFNTPKQPVDLCLDWASKPELPTADRCSGGRKRAAPAGCQQSCLPWRRLSTSRTWPWAARSRSVLGTPSKHTDRVRSKHWCWRNLSLTGAGLRVRVWRLHHFKGVLVVLPPALLFSSRTSGERTLSSWAGRNDTFVAGPAPPLLPHQPLSFFRFSHIPPLRCFRLSSSLHFSFSGLLLISSGGKHSLSH